MKKTFSIFIMTIFCSLLFISTKAQTPFINYKGTDINGNSIDISSYLSKNMLVVLDFMESNCGPCMSYHNTGALNNLYQHYGPAGTVASNQVMCLMFDVLSETGVGKPNADLYGNNYLSYDWVTKTKYPIVDLDPNNKMDDYNFINSYSAWGTPSIWKICPINGGKKYEAGYPVIWGTSGIVPTDSTSEEGLYKWYNGPICLNKTSTIAENIEMELSISTYPSPANEYVNIFFHQKGAYDVSLVNAVGQTIQKKQYEVSGDALKKLELQDCLSGIYYVVIAGEKSVVRRRIIISH